MLDRTQSVAPQDVDLAIKVLFELQRTGQINPGKLYGVSLMCMALIRQAAAGEAFSAVKSRQKAS